jgi:endoribonuclease Nob1
MKQHYFIIDTSAILSGLPLNLGDVLMVTTPKVAAELQPGGRDHRTFELLQSKGLIIQQPSHESIQTINTTAKDIGERDRLSPADIEILALAYEIKNQMNADVVILSDDYSIQNIASTLSINFQAVSQQGITKKFKWRYRCPGCKKQFDHEVKTCPICGTQTKLSVQHKQKLT